MLPIIVGPLAALVVIGLILIFRSRAARQQLAEPQRKVRLLVHSINDDRCTGCDACVLVCPTDVLELRNNKSRVLRFGDCIQCEQCAQVCPTQALVMHYEGTEPPPVLVPELDEFYQANVQGLYLIGEAAGKPLVKNGVNLGRAAIEHSLRTGLKPRSSAGSGRGRQGETVVDVVIIGSGPAGLSAAMSCVQRGLSHVVLEKDAVAASTIARYPKSKQVMAEPYDVRCVGLLPVWDASKDQTILEWNRILSQVDLDIRLREVVEDVGREGAEFVVRTDKGVYRGQRCILGVGTRGKPRRLGVPGEDAAYVLPLLDDPDQYRGETVLVIGGGDSAVEAALALCERELGNKVLLSYRGKQFNRVKARNRQALDDAVAKQKVLLLLGSKVVSFQQGQVVLQLADGRDRAIAIGHAFVLIGGDPPVKWLEGLGIRYVQRPHSFALGPTDQLVERLIGRQQSMDRPGMPIPVPVRVMSQMLSAPDNEATLMEDRGDIQGRLRAALAQTSRVQGAPPAVPGHGLASLGKTDRAGDRHGVTIMVPKEQFLLHLPEKMQAGENMTTVAELQGLRQPARQGERPTGRGGPRP